ncbi:MAG TPA: PaaI family thioesterase [Trebonia sp.]|nr:PaaI family thioesterase [Trebonia sp.]
MADEEAAMPAGNPGWGAPSSKVVQWYDPMITAAGALGLSGYEFMSAIMDGKLPPPPIASLVSFRVVEIEVGRIVFECTPDASVYNPIGTVHGGVVCTLADSAAACAVHTTLAAGLAYTSIDLNVSYLRPVTRDSGTLRAIGTVTKPGRRVAFSSVEVFDSHRKLVATATSSCLVMSLDAPS